jgi:hypothetical protein
VDAERLLRDFAQSRMTRKVFCRMQGIALHTLDYYRHRQKRREQGKAGQLLAVELVGQLPGRGSCLRVELGNGRRIAVEEGFDAHLLKRLVAALED